MSSLVNCITDACRVEGHSLSLRLASGRAGPDQPEAEGMPLNFVAYTGGEGLLAPEGFMGDPGAQVDNSNYYTKLRSKNNVRYRPRLKSMDTLPFPANYKVPEEISYPEIERFFNDVLRHQDSLARMFWTYIKNANKRLDDTEAYIVRINKRLDGIEVQTNERLDGIEDRMRRRR